MSKKSKFTKKKHHFKSAPAAAVEVDKTASGAVESVRSTPVATASGAAGVFTGRNLAYVSRDVKHILVIAGALTAAQLVLWYLFSFTALGSHVYSLIKV